MLNAKTNLRNHLAKFKELLVADKLYVLLIFGFLIIMNPFDDKDTAELYKARKGFPQEQDWDSWNYAIYGYRALVIPAWLGLVIKTNQRVLRGTPNYILWILLIQFLSVFLSLLAWYVSYTAVWPIFCLFIASDFYTNIRMIIISIICVQNVTRNVKEGYESFNINAVTSILNIAILSSELLAKRGIDDYLKDLSYSSKSFNLVCLVATLQALCTILLAWYFMKKKNTFPEKTPVTKLKKRRLIQRSI